MKLDNTTAFKNAEYFACCREEHGITEPGYYWRTVVKLCNLRAYVMQKEDELVTKRYKNTPP